MILIGRPVNLMGDAEFGPLKQAERRRPWADVRFFDGSGRWQSHARWQPRRSNRHLIAIDDVECLGRVTENAGTRDGQSAVWSGLICSLSRNSRLQVRRY